MSLTLDQAEKIVQGAIKKAGDTGIAISVAVVDAGGHLIALERMDGAMFITADIARGKAFTAAAVKMETVVLAERASQMLFFASAPQVGGDRITALPGGIPILRDGQVAGAVGASGGTGEQDIECARAGLAKL